MERQTGAFLIVSQQEQVAKSMVLCMEALTSVSVVELMAVPKQP